MFSQELQEIEKKKKKEITEIVRSKAKYYIMDWVGSFNFNRGKE